MADNTTINPGSGGDQIATDDISGVKYPRGKVGWGPDGTYNEVDAATGKPLPIQIRRSSDGAEVGLSGLPLRVDPTGTTTQPVSGSVSISGSPTVDTELPAPAALADTTANPTTPTTGAANLLYNGTTWDRARGDITNGLDVDVTRVQGNVAITSAAASQSDGHSVTLGATTDAAAAGDTSNVGLIALIKRLLQRITTLIGQLPSALTGSGNLKAAIVESSATVTVSGTVTANAGSGTLAVDTEMPSASALADAAGNPTTPIVGGANLLYNGSTWDRTRGDITNGLDVDVTRQPARTRTTDSISVVQSSDAIMDNLTALTISRASISVSSSGNTEIIAAQTSKVIQIHRIYLKANAAVNIKLVTDSGGTPTDLTGAMPCGGQADGISFAFSPVPHVVGTSGKNIALNLSGAVSVAGFVVYTAK